jgi:hypothetical protein
MSKSRTAKARSGGGLTSNKLVHPKVRVGPPRSDVMSPSATDMLGQQTSFKKPPLQKGTMPQVRSGNDVAEATVCGPGGSRTVYARGVQSTYGATAKGEPGMQGAADRGSRAILGPDASMGKQVPFRKGQQQGE